MNRTILYRYILCAVFCLGISLPSVYARADKKMPQTLDNTQKELAESVQAADDVPACSANEEASCDFEDSLTVQCVTSTPILPPRQKVDFNPRKYQLQKRHLPKGDPFSTKPFYNQLFIGGSLAIQEIAPQTTKDIRPGWALNGFIGYNFTPLHTFRLSGSYGEYTIAEEPALIRQATAGVDYLFNVTNYLYGYRKHRIFTISGMTGLGVMASYHNGNWAKSLKAELGAHLAFRLGRNGELFAEPFIALAQDNIDHSGSDNPSFYDVYYGLRLGASMNFSTEKGYYEDLNYNGNYFFDISQGLTMAYRLKFDDIMASMGTNYTGAIGRWFTPIIGARISGSISDYYWGKNVETAKPVPYFTARPTYETRNKAAIFTARMEMLLNPIHFSERWRKEFHRFDLNLALGAEFGAVMKYGQSGKSSRGLNTYYRGITGAMQFLYNVNHSTALFVEPRGLIVDYEREGNTKYPAYHEDKIGSVNLGIRVMRPTKEQIKARNTEFTSHLFVGGQIGGMKHLINSKLVGDDCFNLATAVNIGYEYAPLAAAKFQLEYNRLNRNVLGSYKATTDGRQRTYSGEWMHTYSYLNMKLGYLLNLTNLYQKHDADRRLNFYGQFGPMYSVVVGQDSEIYSKEPVRGLHPESNVKDVTGRGAWALFGGAVVDYRLNEKWSVYLEPEIQHFLKRDFIGRGAFQRFYDTLFKFSAGATYRF